MKKYTIMLPPPNVSGYLHMGHGLNFFLQDFLIKTRKMIFANDITYMLPGLDHGSMATQYSALKNINNLEKYSNEEKYQFIYNFSEDAKKNIIYQMRNFNLDLNEEFLQYTMNKEHIQLVNESFVKLYEKGLIYEDERIVYWDPLLNTSLSNLEVIYKTVTDKLYYIKYKLKNPVDGENYIIIATTRPETIFGDTAIAVGVKNHKYTGNIAYIPLTNKEIPIIFDEEYVKDDFGTGILKVTPAYDENDFNIGKKHNLPIVHIYDYKNNNFYFKKNLSIPSELHNLSIKDGKEMILKLLNNLHLITKEESYTHSIMIGDKTLQPIHTIVKKQWYLNLESSAKKALKYLDLGEFKIFPLNQWEGIYKSFLNNLKPWCISRENLWGHKIPVWRSVKDNNKIIVAINEEEALKKNHNEPIIRDSFLLDTWFSSGLWPLLYKKINANLFPMDLLVTGYDIIFFWVARMVMLSVELYDTLPFKNVLIHNLVRDGEGEKMSKTRGNVINPMDIIKEYNTTDVLRYSLLSKITLRGQIRFSGDDLKNTEKLITKIKNSIRFLKLHYKSEDFISIYKIIEINIKSKMVSYFIHIFQELNFESIFKDYNIYNYINNLYDFFWNIYCSQILEMSKNQLSNNEIKFMLIYLIKKILKLFYGLMPTVTNDLYNEFFNVNIVDDNHKIKINYFNNFLEVESMKELINVINQLRSLKSSNILNGKLLTNEEEEINIFISLKLNTVHDNYEGSKYFYIEKRKIYYEDINTENMKKYIEKKEEELKKVKEFISNNPPEDIYNQFKNKENLLLKELNYLTCFK
jgi:valyl-tRNA synthetase